MKYLITMLIALCGLPAVSAEAQSTYDDATVFEITEHAVEVSQAVRAILSSSEEEIDFARTKLAVDRLIDPATDGEAILARIDAMAETVRAMAGPSASSAAKVAAVRRFIYESGPWNDHRPFAYDMSDPLGRELKNKLLATYLTTRRGNCVSMPILFLILADRLGVEVSLSTAPHHMFVKYKNEAGRMANLETTSGGHPARDVWYRQNTPMTDEAITNGLYLNAHTRRETAAIMALVLLEHYLETAQYEEVQATADGILQVHPLNVDAILISGVAYGQMIQKEFTVKYPRPIDIPPAETARYLFMAERNQAAFEAAETLGWLPEE